MTKDDENRKNEADAFFAFLKKNREEVARLPAWMKEAHRLSPEKDERWDEQQLTNDFGRKVKA